MVYLPTFSWFCGKLVTVNIQSSHGCYGLYHISSTKSPNKPEPLRLQFLFTEARRHCPRSLEPSSKWRSWSPPPHDDEMDVDRPQKSNLRYPKWPIWHIWKESPPFPRPIILGILQPLLFGDVFIWKFSSWSRGIWHLLALPGDTRWHPEIHEDFNFQTLIQRRYPKLSNHGPSVAKCGSHICRNIRSRFVSYSQVLFPVAMNLLDTVSWWGLKIFVSSLSCRVMSELRDLGDQGKKFFVKYL